MATNPPMNENFCYDWGETVRVVATALSVMRPGQVCSICGMRQHEAVNLYLVEFSDGDAFEVPENQLQPMIVE